MRHFQHLSDLQPLIGQELGLSDWLLVDQDRINQFAHATGDHQWIHTDPVRAAVGPFGGTIAHGFLTLSLVPLLSETCFDVADVVMGINYGLNRVRFVSPVRSGSQVRARSKLLSFDALPGGAQLSVEVTVELQGQDKPACVAEAVTRRFVATP